MSNFFFNFWNFVSLKSYNQLLEDKTANQIKLVCSTNEKGAVIPGLTYSSQ